jgi:tRNA nucleotidyltransferase (CCA-adding enzyme)
VFSSDGLRILRLIRFACELDLNIEKETFKAASRYAFQLKDISKERILKELKLMITSDSRNEYDGNAHVRALRLINKLDLWRYIFNSDYKKFKVVLRGEVFNMYKNCKPEHRFDAFICLVFYSIFKSFTFNDQLIEFYLNNLLGVDGLKIQKNIPTIRSMIYALREITNKNVSVYEHNRQSIMFNNLSDSAKAIIKSGFDMQEIEEHIFELQANKVPFKISDVDITSKELMELGVVNKALSKVFGLILFELISETIKNNKEDIVKFVTENLKDYIRK